MRGGGGGIRRGAVAVERCGRRLQNLNLVRRRIRKLGVLNNTRRRSVSLTEGSQRTWARSVKLRAHQRRPTHFFPRRLRNPVMVFCEFFTSCCLAWFPMYFYRSISICERAIKASAAPFPPRGTQLHKQSGALHLRWRYIQQDLPICLSVTPQSSRY